jgi:solute carrier family 25 carnitine/acylcarnitine transporter 20/29
MYKGMTPPLISLSILNTLNFASYNLVRNQFNASRGWDIRNGLAAFVTAPLGSSISTVENMIKTQMQIDNVNEKRYKGSFHCLTTLVGEHGWKVIYTGHVINTFREGAFLGIYFYTYEGMRVSLQKNFGQKHQDDICTQVDSKGSTWTVPLAGGLSGAWAWFLTFPMDCVKAGVQGQVLSRKGEHLSESNTKGTIAPRKLGAIEVLRDLLETKGWRGLYAGVSPSIMRAFLVSASRFSAYEIVSSQLRGEK